MWSTECISERAPTLTTDLFSTVYPEPLAAIEGLVIHTMDGGGAPNTVHVRLTVLLTFTSASSEYISMVGGIAANRRAMK